MCVQFQVIGINEEKEICMPDNEYVSGHREERINIVYMQITAELKVYWLLVTFKILFLPCVIPYMKTPKEY